MRPRLFEILSDCENDLNRGALDAESEDVSSPKFWEKLKENFDTLKQLLGRDAANRNLAFDVESTDLDDKWKEQEWRKQEARNHPLSKLAERYEFLVKEWFDRETDAVDEAYRHSLETESVILPEELKDAIEVIRWYQHMPAVKLSSALMRDEDDRKPYQIDDKNGRMKVALIAMDRSVFAWRQMLQMFPDNAASIEPIIARLEELRKLAEREFPNARSFIRPGLDEISNCVM